MMMMLVHFIVLTPLIPPPHRRGSTRPEVGGGCDCPVLLWSAGHTRDSVGQVL